MGKCLKCGKFGLFLKIDVAGLCKDCALEAERQKQLERETQILNTRAFIGEVSAACSAIPAYPPLLSGFGYSSTGPWLSAYPLEKILEIQNACKKICDLLPRRLEYPLFKEVFISECVPVEGVYGTVKHPAIHTSYFDTKRGNFSKLFDDLIDNAHSLYTDTLLAEHTETLSFKVVGVTFKNGRRNRQTILRQIHFRDPPYTKKPNIHIEKYEHEGSPAFAVYANDEQVGNIGSADISQLLDRWGRYKEVIDFSVYGGGDKNFGMKITVKFSR